MYENPGGHSPPAPSRCQRPWMQPLSKTLFVPNPYQRFCWVNLIRFGQNQNLASPKTSDLLRLTLFKNTKRRCSTSTFPFAVVLNEVLLLLLSIILGIRFKFEQILVYIRLFICSISFNSERLKEQSIY